MGFQLGRVTPDRVGRIKVFKKMPDQLVSCDTFVHLDVIFEGSLTGHKITWEQVKGYPVKFITPINQFSVTYENPAIQDTKVFRCWINKGKRKAKFVEVYVYNRPEIWIDDTPTLIETPSMYINANHGTFGVNEARQLFYRGVENITLIQTTPHIANKVFVNERNIFDTVAASC